MEMAMKKSQECNKKMLNDSEYMDKKRSKLHIMCCLIISRISYALSAWGGFLNSQQINRMNVFIRKAPRFGICSSACLYHVSEYLRMVDRIVYKVLPTASHIYFHQKSTAPWPSS